MARGFVVENFPARHLIIFSHPPVGKRCVRNCGICIQSVAVVVCAHQPRLCMHAAYSFTNVVPLLIVTVRATLLAAYLGAEEGKAGFNAGWVQQHCHTCQSFSLAISTCLRNLHCSLSQTGTGIYYCFAGKESGACGASSCHSSFGLSFSDSWCSTCSKRAEGPAAVAAAFSAAVIIQPAYKVFSDSWQWCGYGWWCVT